MSWIPPIVHVNGRSKEVESTQGHWDYSGKTWITRVEFHSVLGYLFFVMRILPKWKHSLVVELHCSEANRIFLVTASRLDLLTTSDGGIACCVGWPTFSPWHWLVSGDARAQIKIRPLAHREWTANAQSVLLHRLASRTRTDKTISLSFVRVSTCWH